MLQPLPLPEAVTSFDEDLNEFIEKYAALWQSTSCESHAPGPPFTPAAQRRNESVAAGLVDSMEEEFRNYPTLAIEQSAWRRRIFGSLRTFGTECFCFPDRHFDIIFSPEYFEVTKSFARRAREFDEGIDSQSLAQALRNVWVMNCLQMFLGSRPTLTPSVFAYSMLYPYTDNYLDQPQVAPEFKLAACRRLAARLGGSRPEPLNSLEEAIALAPPPVAAWFARNTQFTTGGEE